MKISLVVEIAFTVDRNNWHTVERQDTAVDGVVVHERVNVTALLFQYKVSDDGNHVLASRNNVLLTVARNPFGAVVQLDPALSPIVDQGGLDHIGTIQLGAIRIKDHSVKVVDCVDAGNAVIIRTHGHHAEAEASRVLERFRASNGIAATLEQVVKELVVIRIASVPDERKDRILVHDCVHRVGDDVEDHPVSFVRNVATVRLCPLRLAVEEVTVGAHLFVVVGELPLRTVTEVTELIDD